MLGILVDGGNHWIVSGPCPDAEQARWLIRQWSVIQIGKPPAVNGWEICTKAFREDLQWAVAGTNPEPHSAAVVQLLAELSARGVAVRQV